MGACEACGTRFRSLSTSDPVDVEQTPADGSSPISQGASVASITSGVSQLSASPTPGADVQQVLQLEELDKNVWKIINNACPDDQTKFLLETLLFHKKDGEDFWKKTKKGGVFEIICKHLLASHLKCSPGSFDITAAGTSGTQGDGGVDLAVEASPGMRWIIDAKAKKEGASVPASDVRSIIGALSLDPKTATTSIGRAVVITNSRFTAKALTTAETFNSLHPSGGLQCLLLDGKWVRDKMKHAVENKSGWLMSVLNDFKEQGLLTW